ncbi:MAG: GNAT family N-acetyltransferase [Rhodospirillales bacterium]|nr:MAG: GNAT family N-acetyltransferase [Rhodospirillales bacterium]
MADDAGALAALYRAAFAEPWERAWSAGEFAALLSARACGGSIAAAADGAPAGFIVWRVAADEAEIITLGVAPASRRAGLARRLVTVALESWRRAGAAAAFLEVAADNAAALALYRSAGFATVGRRTGYYARGGGTRVDALVLRAPLA